MFGIVGVSGVFICFSYNNLYFLRFIRFCIVKRGKLNRVVIGKIIYFLRFLWFF